MCVSCLPAGVLPACTPALRLVGHRCVLVCCSQTRGIDDQLALNLIFEQREFKAIPGALPTAAPPAAQ